jgi:hypothetical protein
LSRQFINYRPAGLAMGNKKTASLDIESRMPMRYGGITDINTSAFLPGPGQTLTTNRI